MQKKRSHATSGIVLEYEFDFKLNRSHSAEHQLSEIAHSPLDSTRSHDIGFNQFRSLSKADQLSYLVTQVWRRLLHEPRYAITMVGSAISGLAADLINVYFVLWLSRFVNSGVLTSQDQVKSIFESIIMWSGISLACALPLIGWATDRLPPFTVLLVGTVIRGALLFVVQTIEDPNSLSLKVLVPVIFVLTALQQVCLDIIFLLHQPKNLRGALSGTRVLTSNLFSVIFIYWAGFQFDNVDKNAPFNICGVCDLVFALVTTVMLVKGLVAYN